MKYKKEKEEKPADAKPSEAAETGKLPEELARQKDELFEKLQRVSADYANFQKRVLKQIEDTVSYEKETISNIRCKMPAQPIISRWLSRAYR